MSLQAEIKPLPPVKRECLGQLAVALLPIEKLKIKSPRGVPFEREIHDFLVTNFNGYTVSSGNISGHWKDDHGHDHYGEHRQYKVAVAAQEGIASFEVFLSEIATEMREECIYVEIGREIFLVYAANSNNR
ncbi:MAG: hypothetical protein ACXW3Z_06070 [Limisphaerales bacterium]